jgi:hypothetical protein
MEKLAIKFSKACIKILYKTLVKKDEVKKKGKINDEQNKNN